MHKGQGRNSSHGEIQMRTLGPGSGSSHTKLTVPLNTGAKEGHTPHLTTPDSTQDLNSKIRAFSFFGSIGLILRVRVNVVNLILYEIYAKYF